MISHARLLPSTSCYARSATSSAKLYHSADASNMDAYAILYHSMSCAVLWNVFRWNHTVVSCLVVWCKSKSIDPCTVKTLSNRTPVQPCQVHGNQSMSRQTSPWRACHGMSQCAVYLHLSSCGQEVAGVPRALGARRVNTLWPVQLLAPEKVKHPIPATRIILGTHERPTSVL